MKRTEREEKVKRFDIALRSVRCIQMNSSSVLCEHSTSRKYMHNSRSFVKIEPM